MNFKSFLNFGGKTLETPTKSQVGVPVQNIEEIEKFPSFNINDTDIFSKLAKVAGCEVGKFNQRDFDGMKEIASSGKGGEWYVATLGVKFFINENGEVTFISKHDGKEDPEIAKKRAKEMGMLVA